MPDLPDCTSYLPDTNLVSYISGAAPDTSFPEFKDFYADYRSWETNGSPADPQEMHVAFGGPDIPTKAFINHRIRKVDCQKFSDYIGVFGGVSALAAAGNLPQFVGRDLTRLKPFEQAVLAFVAGLELTEIDQIYLHGACFLLNRAKRKSFTGSDAGDAEFYAIPAYDVWKNKKDANNALWQLVITQLESAAEVLGKPTINIDLAAQIRLGKRDGKILPSRSIGSGLVIFGFG